MLSPGDTAPSFALPDQDGTVRELSAYAGRPVLVYFYPRADTPGCTQQACGLRDIAEEVGDTAIIGISPDKPAAQKRFDAKYGLGFPLLSDPDHAVAEAFDVWREKKMYGKTSWASCARPSSSTTRARSQEAWYKISPKDTPTKLLEALASSEWPERPRADTMSGPVRRRCRALRRPAPPAAVPVRRRGGRAHARPVRSGPAGT